MRQQQTPNSVALQQSAGRLLETSQQCIDCSTPKMDDINGSDMAENIRSYEQLNTEMKELKQVSNIVMLNIPRMYVLV
jgi:hypothetical protein